MKYVANPVEVDAFVIRMVTMHIDRVNVDLTLDNGQVAEATPAMMARMSPKPGDYWVVQADGYTYLNPKDVFDRKYSPKPVPLAVEAPQ